MNAIELSLFLCRISAICEEMGTILQYTAFSPNIKERQDYSCAIFDSHGQLCAQAAHIPVHLGSMAFAMSDIVNQFNWKDGDMVILNDPYRGGTHLPDVTLIAPVFYQDVLCGFVANRAHHADIGSESPGSMPVATHLSQEGLLIPPSKIMQDNEINRSFFNQLLQQLHNFKSGQADFLAQISANLSARQRLLSLIDIMQIDRFMEYLDQVNHYAATLTTSALESIPDGQYNYSDVMDDDGQGNTDIRISVCITKSGNNIQVDFNGTAEQVKGNINCPLSVTAAAVYYCFYCLLPPQTPPCAGSFSCIEIIAPDHCLVNANYPAAVAAGNVETSTRIVDVILGALAQAIPEKIPAASHGSMNNIAMGSVNWDYYETLGGGMGAHQYADGLDALQTHMTNTLNTPIEVLEKHYPIRIRKYAIRQDSGGQGYHHGGNGMIREYEFLEKTAVTILTERRSHSPWALGNASPGKPGINWLNGKEIPGKSSLNVESGDILIIESAGGGGWGLANNPE